MRSITITLPNKEEMGKRLLSVHDDDHIRGLYSRLLERAGKTINVPYGIVMMVANNMEEHARDEGYSPPVKNALFGFTVPILKALIDNNEAQKMAIEYYEQALEAIRDK